MAAYATADATAANCAAQGSGPAEVAMNLVEKTFEHVQVLRLEPDDVIVLQMDRYPSAAEAESIRAQAETIWPGRRVVVLDKGTTLKIAREAKP
jgi:hypothetical protein